MIKYPLTADTWGTEERLAIDRVLDSGQLTYGPETLSYEKKLADYFGSKYAVSFNSGSSANLAGAFALVTRGAGKKIDEPEVIVPMVSWSTTYYPFTQAGAKLVFVDVERGSLNIDPDLIRGAINRNTVGVVAVNLLGNPARLDEIRKICDDHGLFMFEDNCESMGAKIGDKYAGTFGDIGSFSTFYSHHISTVEGGFAVTDSEELFHLLLSIRSHGWLRDLPIENRVMNKTGDRFLDSYTFAVPGFNLRPTEIASAIGKVQIEKLEGFVAVRRENASSFLEQLSPIPGVRAQQEFGRSSWFGFAIVLDGSSKSREKVRAALDLGGIETRPVVTGNFLRQPVIGALPHTVASSSDVADEIHDFGLMIGNSQESLGVQISGFAEVLSQSLSE
jgi:CDP-6-deoxy-D-xylo-4-hexulose-3-dehydrase